MVANTIYLVKKLLIYKNAKQNCLYVSYGGYFVIQKVPSPSFSGFAGNW